jgi:anaerobic magnesium-protoporphyrin IX monomethyl ester cyclase
MVDVLLTHSNHLFSDSKQTQKMQPYPPLQTILAASVLREAGYSVAFCDITFDNPKEKFTDLLQRQRPGLVVVCEDGFNFLSKMCLNRNRELAYEMAQCTRELGIPSAACSADSTDHPTQYLNAGFDYVVRGEVEPTLLELAAGRSPEGISGIAFRDGQTGDVHYTLPRRLSADLDTLPLPAWDLIDAAQYRAAWVAKHQLFSLNMISSRGCPYRCNWCAKPAYGNTYRVRKPNLVAHEMAYLKRAFNPDHLWFADDIFALSNRWMIEFAEKVEELDARIPFKMQSRCDLMTRSTVDALQRSGCQEVWMGAESGSQSILSAMDKGLRVEQIYEARRNLTRHGIRACFFLQFGYPGEGWEQIEATIRMVRETKPDNIGVSVSYPLPGTKFFDLVSNQIGRKANWSESGDLAMMFQGAFSSDFYRALADALHLEVRNPEGLNAIQAAWDLVHALRDRDCVVRKEVCA